MEILRLNTKNRQEYVNLTAKISEIVQKSGVLSGICHIYVPHATAAIIINENADLNIQNDFLVTLNRLIPIHANYLHDRIDNNAQSHLIASLLGPSKAVPIEKGDLQLGRWQALLFVELDGPRSDRKIYVQIIGS